MEDPSCVQLLAACTAARKVTELEIDAYLEDSLYRDSYTVTEIRDILLDLRKKLELV